MSATIYGHDRGATGAVLWRTSKGLYYWNGPGGRLYLLFGDVSSPNLVTIDDPAADGSYKTRGEAETALRKYLGAGGRRRRRRR